LGISFGGDDGKHTGAAFPRGNVAFGVYIERTGGNADGLPPVVGVYGSAHVGIGLLPQIFNDTAGFFFDARLQAS